MSWPRKAAAELRSQRWFGRDDMRSFGHRSRAKQEGFAGEDFLGKPVIAILNTWSDANPCHAHFRMRAEEVKRGVWQAGGFPLEMPVLSVGETFMKPSPMLYRNLLAMEAEEVLRANPVDGVVLLGGCDKTVPGLLMGATSMNLPALFVPAGPMLRGNWRGSVLGSGTDLWKYGTERRAGNLDECTWREMEDGIARSYGTCMTMGTASTMAAAAEALGMTLPGASSIPAADSGHARLASASTMSNSVPLPTVLRTRSVPPWASAIVLTIDSPRPTPSVPPLRLASDRPKRSKIRSRSSAGMPAPESATWAV